MNNHKKSNDPGRGNKAAVIGIAWYSKDQWQNLCTASADKDLLEDTYEEWGIQSDRKLNELNSKGIHAEKVHINISELLDWCADKKCPVDGEARSSFVTDKLRDKYENQK